MPRRYSTPDRQTGGQQPWKVRIEPPRFEWEGSNDSGRTSVPLEYEQGQHLTLVKELTLDTAR